MSSSRDGGPPKISRSPVGQPDEPVVALAPNSVGNGGIGVPGPGGGGPSAFAKLGSTTIVSGLLSGLLGGLTGVVSFGVADSLGISSANLRRGVLVLAVSICAAVVLAAWSDLTASRTGAAARSVAKATPLAVLGGFVGLALATPPFGWLDGYDAEGLAAGPALMVAFGIVAATVGAAIGLSVAMRKAVLGLVGGLVGGAAGGLVLAIIGGGGEASLGQLALAVPVATMALGATMGATERLGRQCWVEIVDGPLAGREIILYGERSVLGNGQAAFSLGDSSMPDQHLEVLVERGEVRIRSLDGAVPSELNFEPLVGQHTVSGDDVISLGNSHVRIWHA